MKTQNILLVTFGWGVGLVTGAIAMIVLVEWRDYQARPKWKRMR